LPKAILTENFNRRIELGSFSDARWQRLREHIPATLSDEMRARLRVKISACVSRYLTRQAQLNEGMASAWALRRPGKRQAAPLERVAKGLRMAADAWKDIKDRAPSRHRPPFYDDQPSELLQFDKLEDLAKDAERPLAGLRSFGKPQTIQRPWQDLVSELADCFRTEGINPTATGRTYELDAKVTWFQNFMWALQENLLGKQGRPANSRQAFASEVAKALRGDTEPGKARK
jgi:hypothetical protein